MDNVIDEKLVSDENETRFKELNTKQGRTAEEDKELGELKSKYAQSAKQRIDQITAEKHRERLAREDAEKKAQELEERLKALEAERAKPQPTQTLQKNTITVRGQSYYTDDTLLKMIETGEVTQNEAYKHQQDRLKAEAAEEAYQRIKQEEQQERVKRTRDEDFAKVLAKYPQLNTRDPRYNPDDLFTKTVSRLWNNGYSSNPEGLSRAVEDAEEYVKILNGGKGKIDLSSDFSTAGNDVSAEREMQKKKNEVILTDVEKETAIRMYKDLRNPATNRNYTEAESIEKAKRAKQARMR